MSLPDLIDSHCHLGFDEFGADLEDVIGRARASGVAQMVAVACARDDASAQASIELSARWPGLFAAVGVHPHDARLWEPLLARIVERAAAAPRVVAVGETGLDYHYDLSPRDKQREAFRAQIGLARKLDKPVIVHTREAADDTLAILREQELGHGVIHCFSDDLSFARRVLDLGLHVSLSGMVTFKNASTLRDVARFVPADRLLIETDSPYLAPVPHRGRRNEPAYVVLTANAVAQARGEPLETVASATTRNARRLFGIP